jgi:hypothetical protein
VGNVTCAMAMRIATIEIAILEVLLTPAACRDA